MEGFLGKDSKAVSSSGWLQSLTSDRNPSQLVGPMFWIITQYFMENCSSSSRLCYYLGYFHHPKDSEDLDLAFETANSRQWFWFSPTKTLTNNLRFSWAGAQSNNWKPGWHQVPSYYPWKCPHKCSLLIALCTRSRFSTAALCIHHIPRDVLRGHNLSSLHQNNMGPKSTNNLFILVNKWQASITQIHALNVCKLSLVLSYVACPLEQFWKSSFIYNNDLCSRDSRILLTHSEISLHAWMFFARQHH